MKKNLGFTLIELLVVIAIVGLLASITLVAIKEVRKKANDATEKHNLSQIQRALEAYYNDESKYTWDWSRGTSQSSWEDTPCNTACAVPDTVCADYSISGSTQFFEQLVQAGYFTRDQVNRMICEGTVCNNQRHLQMRYFYTCDLQKYKLTVTLFNGTCYKVGHDISHSCPSQ